MQNIRLPPIPNLRDMLRMYKLGAIKKLAQNFILDMNVTNKISKHAGKLRDEYVLEVGPGPGGLTRSILHQGPKKVIVVEKDQRFKPSLELLSDAYVTAGKEMDIIFEDVLSINMDKFFPNEIREPWDGDRPPITIIGNLPFNVATPLIIYWLKAISEKSNAWTYGRTKMTLTFQKEVADRIVAPIRTPERCRLSVMAQAWTEPKIDFYIPRQVFVPKPKVDAGVVSFIPRKIPQTQHNFHLFEKITRHLFSFRQKYSHKCIATLFPQHCRQELTDRVYQIADLNPKLKPMQLEVSDIDRLTSAYKEIISEYPELEMYDYRASRRVLSQNQLLDAKVVDTES